jgi:hypothetical protein
MPVKPNKRIKPKNYGDEFDENQVKAVPLPDVYTLVLKDLSDFRRVNIVVVNKYKVEK